MELVKNPYLESQPVAGKTYKLWSLPVGSVVIRKGLKIAGKEVGPFEIIKQSGSITIGKTGWNWEFQIDASFDVIAN
jgi:hypothetical protein